MHERPYTRPDARAHLLCFQLITRTSAADHTALTQRPSRAPRLRPLPASAARSDVQSPRLLDNPSTHLRHIEPAGLGRHPQRVVRLLLDRARHIERDRAWRVRERGLAHLRAAAVREPRGAGAEAGDLRPVEAEADAHDDEHEGDAGRGGDAVERELLQERVCGEGDDEEERPEPALESVWIAAAASREDVRVEGGALDEYY